MRTSVGATDQDLDGFDQRLGSSAQQSLRGELTRRIQRVVALEDRQQPGRIRSSAAVARDAPARPLEGRPDRDGPSRVLSCKCSAALDLGTPSPQNQASRGTWVCTHAGAAEGSGGPPEGASSKSSSAQARDTATGSATVATRRPSS